jgi:Enoyl-(Acyl carrier protein) reductase
MSAMSAFDLKGKRGLVLGLANEHSIAWGCARQAQAMGAEVIASCLNDKARAYVEPLTQPLGMDLQTCNIETPQDLENLVAYAAGKLGQLDFVIHSIAWAPLADLHGRGGQLQHRFCTCDGCFMPLLCHLGQTMRTTHDPRWLHGHHDLFGGGRGRAALRFDGARESGAGVTGALHGVGARTARYSCACRVAGTYSDASSLRH